MTSIYGALVNAVVNIMLIKYIGLQAASISTFVGFLIMWLIREKQNKSELGVSIDKKLFGSLFGVTLILTVVECITSIALDGVLFIIGGIMFLIINRKTISKLIQSVKKRK